MKINERSINNKKLEHFHRIHSSIAQVAYYFTSTYTFEQHFSQNRDLLNEINLGLDHPLCNISLTGPELSMLT